MIDHEPEREVHVARTTSRRTERGSDLVLLVIGTELFATYDLPAEGSLVIGRSSACDVVIDHASVSRRHAVISTGTRLTLVDAGSVNGTRVDGKALDPGQPRDIAPGDRIELGTIQLVIQAGPGAARAPRETRMQALHRLVPRIARGSISVLILGETGVGKEVLAETIHRLSPRADRPFLRLHCAALSPALIESELFGHERGAFTGAHAGKPGLLQTADGGTVFLDEVGELPPLVQAKLLRVVEDGRVLPVGGLEAAAIDVRFVSATNRDLEVEVERGAFRRDLLMRLDGITLTIPPLRERRAEIRSLAALLLRRACLDAGRPPLTLSAETVRWLRRYSWPGNIRELKHVMERAAALCTGETITLADLPTDKLRVGPAATPLRPVEEDESLDFTAESRRRERSRLIAALKASGGNQAKAAELLGISRRTLLTWLDRHALPRPRKKT